MLRILALVTFVALLALGQSGRISAEAAAVSGADHIIAPSTDALRPGTAHRHSDRCPASQRANHADCCHASCFAPFALGLAGGSLDGDCGVSTAFPLYGPDLRSVNLKRDPPIPRPLV